MCLISQLLDCWFFPRYHLDVQHELPQPFWGIREISRKLKPYNHDMIPIYLNYYLHIVSWFLVIFMLIFFTFLGVIYSTSDNYFIHYLLFWGERFSIYIFSWKDIPEERNLLHYLPPVLFIQIPLVTSLSKYIGVEDTKLLVELIIWNHIL